MQFFDESREKIEEIQKLDVSFFEATSRIEIGDVVRWNYETPTDYLYGSLYIVMGLDAERLGVVITRVLDNPHIIKEFHMSQLSKV